MLSHQQRAIQDDSGPQVVPAAEHIKYSEQPAEMTQDDVPHMESAAIFDSSVFVRLGQSLELSSSHQINQNENIHADNVSIISRDEAKENDHHGECHPWTSSSDDDHLTRTNRVESFIHRFKTAVGLDDKTTISSVVEQYFSSCAIGHRGCLVALFAMVVAMMMMMMMNHVAHTPTTSPTMPPSPTEDLQSFVTLERSRINDMDKLEDLKTDGFQRYARSACVTAETLEQAQKALFIQLSGIPEDVRKHTIERALIEGITHRSSMQDSSTQLDNGRAHSYMAFWSTVYHPRGQGRNGFKYETCVLVAGMEIGMTEVIAGYKTEEKKVVIGSTPCECGYFYCAGTCPIFHKVIEKTPIFQRHSLSLKQQDALHHWLVKNAIDAAEGIVLSGSSNAPKLPNTNDGTNENASWEVEVLGWKKPPLVDAFLLDES